MGIENNGLATTRKRKDDQVTPDVARTRPHQGFPMQWDEALTLHWPHAPLKNAVLFGNPNRRPFMLPHGSNSVATCQANHGNPPNLRDPNRNPVQ